MSQQPNGGFGGLLIVAAIIYFTYSGGGIVFNVSPVPVDGIVAAYFWETDDADKLTPEQYNIYNAKGPGSVRAELEASAHKTDGSPDVRLIDKDSDVSRCLPVMSEIRKRWTEAGSPLPWRGIYSKSGFYEGTPSSVSDEVAKIKSLQ